MSADIEENQRHSMRVLTLHEVAELLQQLQERYGGFRSATQRRVFEYIQHFLFLSKEEVNELIDKLEALGIPRKVAIQIAYILPVLPEEVRPFLTQMRQLGVKIESPQELIDAIINLTKPLWEKNKDTILTLKNLSKSQLKKLSEEQQ